MGEPAISFGPYRLVAVQRLLLKGDKPVRLGSRAFDILTALIERAGEVVGKDKLIALAWPARFVDEANLKIEVSALTDANASLVGVICRRLDGLPLAIEPERDAPRRSAVHLWTSPVWQGKNSESSSA